MSLKRRNSTYRSQGGHVKMPSLAFFICLGISLLLWIFMKLSREYTLSYEYTVTSCDVPKGKSVDQLSSNTLSLTFKGRGFYFLNPKFLEKNRHIDLSINNLYKDKGSVETTQFTQNELADYIKQYEDLGSEFVSVTDPNVLFVYVK